MGAPIRVPPTRPSTPTFEHQLPPTRPSTPTFGRIERIAEAPSRADPNLPLVETSSPIQAPPSPMEASQPDRVNSNDPGDDTTEGNEQNGHQTTSVSPQIAHMIYIYMFPSCRKRVVCRSPAHFPLSRFRVVYRSAPFPSSQFTFSALLLAHKDFTIFHLKPCPHIS
ncbi:uncharacterized protein K444DRAFT_297064 [Hyaloscypha bicolor E]|uniref:Uncharacterized protein n=1 Tax=Hyaloscypha bicolor E TaxID=1095630 RepID=A0A2J6SEV3_9HELO|nr:uncharacterized protein K444DRAFT_297064 [Hyaloscypha bicolor E]PMD49292.1 hypothetical protein K444DRAFT_297064 [Hyaloscypha bicolor E]